MARLVRAHAADGRPRHRYRLADFGLSEGAVHAAGAAALRRPDLGVLRLNSPGDLVLLEAGHEADLLAHLGAPAIRTTVVGGVPVAGTRTIH